MTDETDERRILEKEFEDDNDDPGGEPGLRIPLTVIRSRREGVPK